MFGIGMPELILILAVALIVIGPRKLPDVAKALGRALGEFKKATGELKSSLGVDQELGEVRKAFNDINQDIRESMYSTASGKPKEGADPAEPAAAGEEADAPPVSDFEAPLSSVKQAFDDLNAAGGETAGPAAEDPQEGDPKEKGDRQDAARG